MKLAEALQDRVDLNRRIEQLEYRLANNVTVQEGEKTSEEPNALFKEIDRSIEQLEQLIFKINLTNAQTDCDGEPLTRLLARRDVLKLKLQIYRDTVNNASNLANRARASEIKILSAIDVRKYQKATDDLAKALREVDNKIQSTNWQVDLIE